MTDWIVSVLIFSVLPVGWKFIEGKFAICPLYPYTPAPEQWLTQCWHLVSLVDCGSVLISAFSSGRTYFGCRMACPLDYQYHSILCIIYLLKAWPICCCCVLGGEGGGEGGSLLLLFRDLLNLNCISNKYKRQMLIIVIIHFLLEKHWFLKICYSDTTFLKP